MCHLISWARAFPFNPSGAFTFDLVEGSTPFRYQIATNFAFPWEYFTTSLLLTLLFLHFNIT